MDGTLAKQFLSNYVEKSAPVFNQLFKGEVRSAKLISEDSAKLLNKFSKIASGGKRFRGALTTLGYEIFGGKDTESILRASLALEMFHAGVLVHDDIMDDDDTRRGFPTIHNQYLPPHFGESMAINAGDFAFYLSWKILLDCDFGSDNILEAGKIYAEYAMKVVHGQMLDVSASSEISLCEEDILKISELKTASYTGVMPFLIGAALAGAPEGKRIGALEKYGLALGWAFQIQDDYLGLYGEEKKLGKPVGSDLQEGKNTLFMLYLREHGTQAQIEFQKSVLGKKEITEDDIRKMQQTLHDSGTTKHVLDLGWNYVENGKKYISQITSDNNYQNLLESLIVYILERTN